MKKLITVTTDFGDSFAAAQLRAIIASLNHNGPLIENHDVSNFSVVEGAFQIMTLTRFTPEGSVHVGVIDPGVGSDRAGVIIRSKRSWFVGPNNGVLYPSALSEGIVKAWRIQESHISDYVSSTFHGRDVFIKVAVYLAQGKHPKNFRSKPLALSELVSTSLRPGQVVHIDNYGNVKIQWDKKLLVGRQLLFRLKGKTVKIPVVKTFSEVSEGKPLALLGSSETLELAVNLGNAAEKYAVQTGEILKIKEL